MTKLIVDCSTGQQRYEQETPEELAQMELNRQAVEAQMVQQAWDNLIIEQKRRLTECDYTQLADVQANMPDDQKQAWLDYRQALRQISQDVSDPAQVTWPDPPIDMSVSASVRADQPMMAKRVIVLGGGLPVQKAG